MGSTPEMASGDAGNNQRRKFIRPSAARRWLRCPASPMVSASSPRVSGEPAAIGRAVHGLIERRLVGKCAHAAIENTLTGVNADPDELALEFGLDPSQVEEALGLAELAELPSYVGGPGWNIYIERPLAVDLGEVEIRGTADVVAVNLGQRHAMLLDWKTGREHQEDPAQNPQLLLYALAIRQEWPAVNFVTARIDYLRLEESLQTDYDSQKLDRAEVIFKNAVSACMSDDPEFRPGGLV